MKKLLNDFFDRYFHDEESLIILILLAVGLFLLVLIGEILAPLIAAIVIAYLMQGLVNLLLRYGASGRLAFFFVYTLFISLFAVMLLYLMPRAWDQFRLLANEIPKFLRDWTATLMSLPDNYPRYFLKIRSRRSSMASVVKWVALVKEYLNIHWQVCRTFLAG